MEAAPRDLGLDSATDPHPSIGGRECYIPALAALRFHWDQRIVGNYLGLDGLGGEGLVEPRDGFNLWVMNP